MELKENKKPLSARFTASRETLLVSEDGSRCQRFEAGETLPVHSSLFSVAIREGLVPEDPLELQGAPQPAKRQTKSREELVMEGLIKACTALILRGNPEDFTPARGLPRAASVRKLVDFDFTAKDVERAFEQATHEVEQDGNNSKEHSEPSSESAE